MLASILPEIKLRALLQLDLSITNALLNAALERKAAVSLYARDKIGSVPMV
jgi:hypothetical protein